MMLVNGSPVRQASHWQRRVSRMALFLSFILPILSRAICDAQGFPGNPAKGQVVYQKFCLRCHGEALDGKGPEAASLDIPPINFHAPHSRLKDEIELRFTIERGRDLTAMHAWGDNLRDNQIRDVAAYIRSIIPQEKR